MEPIVKLTTSKGDILIKLYSDKSPNTVANILSKAASGFYKNLTFHRVEPGFVVQGGDPLGNGTGGGKINSEINDVPFKRGSVGLARGMDRSISNDAQFYICLATQTCSHLSNEYVNFGEVIEGMDVVDKIAVGDKILDLSDNTK
jgi:cyclophilin family peptidyl-prolyl cis-trans isomerase